MQKTATSPSTTSTIAFIVSLHVQLFLAPAFWVVIVATGAILSRTLPEAHIHTLEILLYVMPAIPLITCAILTFFYIRNSKLYYLAWNLLSIAAAVAYCLYILKIK